MSQQFVIKLLSGTLQGVEYTLTDGDWAFYVGAPSALLDGSAAETLSRSDNSFYVPDQTGTGAFVVRIAGNDVELGQSQRPGDGLTFEEMPVQVGLPAGGLWIAIRAADARWAAGILSFRVPGGLQRRDLPRDATSPRSRSRLFRFAALAALALLMIGLAFWQFFGATRQVRSLTELLVGVPDVLGSLEGRNGEIYVLARTESSAAWARRAVTRAGNTSGVRVVDIAAEASRVGATLDQLRIAYVVIRLDDPARPRVTLSGNKDQTDGLVEPVRKLVMAQLPYADEVRVDALGDEQLVSLAETALRHRGVPVRREGQGARVVLANTSFLDDASMHAMSTYVSAFERTWGTRRVGFRVRQWDDLLGSASYQYDPKRLYSVSENSWRFSTTTKD